jgi:hypothetical protein
MSSKKGSVGVVGVCVVFPVKTVLVEESCVVNAGMNLVVADVCSVLAGVVIVITVETLDVIFFNKNFQFMSSRIY